MPTANPTLATLLSRQSLGARHLREPGPDDAALALMAAAALRAPDHAELMPFRFKAVRGAARARLADLFDQAARDAGKDAAAARIDAERALRAPVTVAVVARIDLGHPLVPAHEQWIAVGAALANFMNAAHALGYAGKMLSGAKVRHPVVQAAFCAAGETLVGWVALGTAVGMAVCTAAGTAVDPAVDPAIGTAVGTAAPALQPRAAKGRPQDVLQDWG